MLKIAIITAYFGKLPAYFSIWLKSCKENTNIDFYVVTDQKIDIDNLPENVKILEMTFDSLRSLINKKLEMQVTLDRSYKLCDFKPAYGFIFGEYLKNYDYWGHCDIDLVWGDLSSFFEKYKLEEYERFLDRGHLSLYRNTYKMNHLFMTTTKEIDFRKVYSTSESCYFDESGMYDITVNSGVPFFRDCLYADIDLFHYDFRHASHPSKPFNYKKQLFFWEKGKVFQAYAEGNRISRNEWCYLHFQKRTMEHIDSAVLNSDMFYITNTGFWAAKEIPDISEIEALNPRGKFKENLNRREYVVCGKANLNGREFLRFVINWGKIIVCSSSFWNKWFKRIWIKAKRI